MSHLLFSLKATGISQPVDERIVQKIRSLVGEGVNNVREMGRHVRQFVKNELFNGQQLPLCTNRRFHPKMVDIRNHMYLATVENRFSKFDQENVSAKTEKWEKENPEDKLFYRPYQDGTITLATAVTSDESKEIDVIESQEEIDIETQEETDVETQKINLEKSLLFVHQTAWQRRLLAKYGNDLCLLDATYKTTRFSVPLFFLVVKTNVDYQVVGSFVTQGESKDCVMEGLKVLSNWNPNWKPACFMTDFSEAEINAIEEIFPGNFERTEHKLHNSQILSFATFLRLYHSTIHYSTFIMQHIEYHTTYITLELAYCSS